MSTSTRDRSYDVRRSIPEGSRVRVLEDAPNGRYQKGDIVTVWTYSNAGFQGIVAAILMEDGTAIHNVPAGILEAA